MKLPIALAFDEAMKKLTDSVNRYNAGALSVAAKLGEVSELLALGLRERAIAALSEACSYEYDLDGDTEATSGFAQALYLEDELEAYEAEKTGFE